MAVVFLPTDKEQLTQHLTQQLQAAIEQRRLVQVAWWIIYHYLRGARGFREIDYRTGKVHAEYFTPAGEIPFKYEEVFTKYANEVGRLLRLDIRPLVKRKAASLDALRKNSAAQAVLTQASSSLNLDVVKRHFIETLVLYGTAGLLLYPTRSTNQPDGFGLEVVPPWEIVGLPAPCKSPADVEVIGRVRWVSFDWLVSDKRFGGLGLKDLNVNDPELQVQRLPAGAAPPTDESGFIEQKKTSSSIKITPDQKRNKEEGVPYVYLQEFWQAAPSGKLQRYIVRLGRKVVVDKTFGDNSDEYIPLGIARLGEGLGFYGKPVILGWIMLTRELEVALRNLLNEVQDFSVLGAIGVPRSWRADIGDVINKPGPKVFNFDRDPYRTNDRIEHIPPATSGTLPAQIIQTAIGLLDRLTQQPAMITQGRVPGRVESTPAIDYLFQASQISLGIVASNIATAFATVYKALLGKARSWSSITLNIETLRDNTVIGILIDPKSGYMSLSKNALPRVDEVEIGIRSQEPVDMNARKEELYRLLQTGLITPRQFRIQARLEGLDIPLPDDVEWQNYRMAILRNIVLFNDGQTPGILPKRLQPSEYEDAEVALEVALRLVNSPEFALASASVQRAFMDLIERYRTQAGQYPEQLEYPEEAAELAQQQQQQQAEMMQQIPLTSPQEVIG
ncbi:MAG: hypothetical protein DRJ64_07565 [Thermoprotei archaeon]|nr:MAG: hypothetical protein DRJ64_07565 [Thermoprotei archaeon]